MRQNCSEKTCRKLSRETEKNVLRALVRGGTGHRYDLFCDDGVMYSYRKGEPLEDGGCRLRQDGKWVYEKVEK